MGHKRACRYVTYKTGKKYDKTNSYALLKRGRGEAKKAEAAKLFTEAGMKLR
jgi:hypothetical protein